MAPAGHRDAALPARSKTRPPRRAPRTQVQSRRSAKASAERSATARGDGASLLPRRLVAARRRSQHLAVSRRYHSGVRAIAAVAREAAGDRDHIAHLHRLAPPPALLPL